MCSANIGVRRGQQGEGELSTTKRGGGKGRAQKEAVITESEPTSSDVAKKDRMHCKWECLTAFRILRANFVLLISTSYRVSVFLPYPRVFINVSCQSLGSILCSEQMHIFRKKGSRTRIHMGAQCHLTTRGQTTRDLSNRSCILNSATEFKLINKCYFPISRLTFLYAHGVS